jgi:hypothetical protein
MDVLIEFEEDEDAFFFFDPVHNHFLMYLGQNNWYQIDIDKEEKSYTIVRKLNEYELARPQGIHLPFRPMKKSPSEEYMAYTLFKTSTLFIYDKTGEKVHEKQFDRLRIYNWLTDEVMIMYDPGVENLSKVYNWRTGEIEELDGFVIGVSYKVENYILLNQEKDTLYVVNYDTRKIIQQLSYDIFTFIIWDFYLVNSYLIGIYTSWITEPFNNSDIYIYDFEKGEFLFELHDPKEYTLIGVELEVEN